METAIIKIGNSKGLRLSKTILQKYNIEDKVESYLKRNESLLNLSKHQEKTGKLLLKK
jgi:antitoxin MazE